ncbi:hypothetical protein Hanom_Chr13g01218791 [Helianthus anomalus]
MDLLKEPPVAPLKRYNRYNSLKAVHSLKALCLVVHPITGESLEEGEIVADLSHEQLLALNEMKENRTSSDNPTDSFEEWRKRFLSKVERPTPPEAKVDFLQFEKVKPHGKIMSWMFVKEIHCVAIKREFGIQYFSSLLSILSLPFYDVVALTKLELVNRSNFEGASLFARKIKINKRT